MRGKIASNPVDTSVAHKKIMETIVVVTRT